jgi:hypothetical protein
MKHIAGAFGILVVAMTLGGCAGSKTKAQTPNDVALARGGDAFDAMNDELSHAIGTTSLTSDLLLAPMPLPGERMSLAEDSKPADQTWGSSAQLDLGEIPDTRE